MWWMPAMGGKIALISLVQLVTGLAMFYVGFNQGSSPGYTVLFLLIAW